MENILRDKANGEDFSTMKRLNLVNMNLSSLDEGCLNKLINLEYLDVSRNELKHITGLRLKCLKTLNCEDNAISNILFLSGLPTLEHVNLNGNPINVADRFIIVDQLSKLETLDGKPCTNIKAVIEEFEKLLNKQFLQLYQSKYESILKCCSSDEVGNYIKQFSRDMLHKVGPFSKAPAKYQRYKVQLFLEEKLKDCINLNKKGDSLHYESSKGQATNPTFSPFAKATECSLLFNKNDTLKEKIADKLPSLDLEMKNIVLSPRKMKRKHESELRRSCRLSYTPHIFLRCHAPTNDPQDSDAPVWDAAFEPDIKNKDRTTDTVATCGGNIVCFINCKTGRVLKRYKCESVSENLFTLSWSVVQVHGNEVQHTTTILATAGSERKIHLIHPSQLKCYSVFKAHIQDINCLCFHPSEPTLLFSGSSDMRIHLWDIGKFSLPNYKTVCQKLMTFEAESEVLRLLVLESCSCLLTACSQGLYAWKFDKKNSNKWTSKSHVSLKIPASCKSKGKELVDGLDLVSNDCIATKVSSSGRIFIWRVSDIFVKGQFPKKKSCDIYPIVVFSWSSCTTDYNYIRSCKDVNVIGCGDNEGNLWLYDAQNYIVKDLCNLIDPIEPPSIILQWPKLSFENEALQVREKVIINSVQFSWDASYIVACTDSNLLCIWKKD